MDMSHKSSIFALKSDMLLRKKYILFLLACCGLWACTHKVPEETLQVVAQADSLWQAGKMYGVDEGDSATLAQAYETLKDRHSSLFSFVLGPSSLRTSYAHACYHYGKLLRAKDDPEEAMRCFINATHSRTRDYYILGRVYSNMGSICHLAGEYQLSYDMYEKSADMFLQDGDTLSYYYGLNDMAFEKAMLADKVCVFALTNTIEKECRDTEVLAKVLETKASLYLRTHQYDLAIYNANLLFSTNYHEATGLLIKAQAYSYLAYKDSAVYYAQQVLELPCTLYEANNALYILANDDETRDRNSIRAVAADRADTQKLIEIARAKYAQAVQVLEWDSDQKPDRGWIWTLVTSVLFVLVVLYIIYLLRKRKLHQRIIKDIRVKEKINSHLSNNINALIYTQEVHRSEIIADIEKSCQLFQDNQVLYDRLHWKDYDMMCESANRYLYNIVAHLQPYNLSEKEVRLCILVLLKASTEKMVDLIPYAHSGIGKFKYTAARKLGTKTVNMRTFILNLLG